MSNVIPSAERFFRLYFKHCVNPDPDTLFNLFNSIHSLNDKLNKSINVNFFESSEFIALKALRNLYHHQDELNNIVRLLPIDKVSGITSELAYLCLVSVQDVRRAIDNIPKKFRNEHKTKIENVFHYYGEVVNINTCIFNFAVKVYETIAENNICLTDKSYIEFRNSYNYETENGFSHYVTGDIACLVGDISTLLKTAFEKIA